MENDTIETSFGKLSLIRKVDALGDIFFYPRHERFLSRNYPKQRERLVKRENLFLSSNFEIASSRDLAFAESQKGFEPPRKDVIKEGIKGFVKEGVIFLPQSNPSEQSKYWYDYEENWKDYLTLEGSVVLLVRDSHKVLRENYDDVYYGGGIKFRDGGSEERGSYDGYSTGSSYSVSQPSLKNVKTVEKILNLAYEEKKKSPDEREIFILKDEGSKFENEFRIPAQALAQNDFGLWLFRDQIEKYIKALGPDGEFNVKLGSDYKGKYFPEEDLHKYLNHQKPFMKDIWFWPRDSENGNLLFLDLRHDDDGLFNYDGEQYSLLHRYSQRKQQKFPYNIKNLAGFQNQVKNVINGNTAATELQTIANKLSPENLILGTKEDFQIPYTIQQIEEFNNVLSEMSKGRKTLNQLKPVLEYLEYLEIIRKCNEIQYE